MGFHEVLFPTNISYGSQGGPGFSTHVIELDSGAEERVARWTQARRRYNIAYGVKTHEDLAALITFYVARQGPANGFRFKDFHDRTSSLEHISTELGGTPPDDEDVQIGTGDGTTTQFQLIKRYTSGPTTTTRKITKPVTGTTLIALNGVGQGSGWTVNTTTGVVTFTVAPALDVVITAGFQFDVPVRFGREVDEVLGMRIDQFGYGSSQEIPLVEILDEGVLEDEFFYGGAGETTLSANFTTSLGNGRVQSYNPQSAGLRIVLPDPTTLPYGGPYFYIINRSVTNTFTIRYPVGTTLATVATGSVVTVVLEKISGAKAWRVF